MKNKFMDKVKAAEGLANKERVRKIQLKKEKCLKLLDDVKQHGGPLTPTDVDKLKGLTDAQVLMEIKYLRQTVAPNIREKRKVGNKFVKFTREELEGQILNVLKPENMFVDDIDQLLLSAMEGKESANTKDTDCDETKDVVGKVAVVEGPLTDKTVGFIVNATTVQLYHVTRYGFEPDDTTEDLSDYKVVQIIEDYDFITRRTGVYLRCSLS